MSTEKYLAIDVGGTAIKYAITDKNAEINKINEIKTRREREELFESLDEIIHPPSALKSDCRHCDVISRQNKCSKRNSR